MRPQAKCMVKTMKAKIAETRCGRETTITHATIWWRDVTCRDCTDGVKARDDFAESLEARLREDMPA